MKNFKISIGIVLYKWEKYIPYFLDSLLKQNFNWEIEILFRDNDTDLIATKKIKKNLKNRQELPKNISIKYFNWGNIWHSWWQNFLMSKMTWDVYFCASNDMFYPENCFEKIVNKLVPGPLNGPGTNLFFPKSMIWDFSKVECDFKKSLTDKVDSYWLWITEKHYFFDIWQWKKEWDFVFDKNKIFWCSWSFIILKKEIIEKLIKTFWFVFDEKNVPHYKNDIEFSYRLNSIWEKVEFLDEIKVYHDRQVSWKKWHFSKNDNSVKQSIFWHLVILRKFTWNFWLKTKLKIFIFELQKFIFILFFKTKNISVYFDFFKEKDKIKKIKIHKKELEKIKWKFQ